MPPSETTRESLRRVLREGPATARDLSRRVGIPERDVPAHLEHLARSVEHAGERLVMEPPACFECGFVFRRRRRYARPGRCPQCHSTRTSLPTFSIEKR